MCHDQDAYFAPAVVSSTCQQLLHKSSRSISFIVTSLCDKTFFACTPINCRKSIWCFCLKSKVHQGTKHVFQPSNSCHSAHITIATGRTECTKLIHSSHTRPISSLHTALKQYTCDHTSSKPKLFRASYSISTTCNYFGAALIPS